MGRLSFFKWFFSSRVKAGITILVLIALGFWGYKTFASPTPKLQYQTQAAQKGTLISSVTASGTISAGNSASITTQATGVVTNVYVKDGDTVSQGEKIADIQLDLNGQQKQAAAYSSFVSANDALLNAQNTLRGTSTALEKTINDIQLAHGSAQAAAQNETETEKNARTAAEVAKDNAFNGVKSAQAGIAAASLSLSQTSGTITAPTSGTITGLTLTPGVVISENNSSSSNSNTSSTSYGSITLGQSQIQAKVNLSEIDVTKVNVGQKATLTLDAFPDKTFTGRVTALDTNGAVSSGVTTYPVTITLDTALNNIYPNMGVNATIITNVKDNVLLVPSAAVQNSNGAETVRILRNGQVQNVDVQVGDSNETQTEVTAGVNEGDQVVTGQTGGTRTTGTTGSTSPFGGGGFGGGVFRGGGGGGNVRVGAGRGG
jgi:membrane fusion protein, macrolide-specific efflux system